MKKRGIYVLMLLVMVLSVYSAEQNIKIDFVGADYELTVNDVLNIEVGEEKVFLDIKKITEEYVDLRVGDEIIKLSSYYPARMMDIDDDGYFDITVNLKEFDSKKIVLNIKKIKVKDSGWIAFDEIPVVEPVGTAKVNIDVGVEVVEEESDNKELYEQLLEQEMEKDEEISPLTNLTDFSKEYFERVKTAIIQVPYIGFIVSGLVILTVLILIMEFGFSKKKVKKKKTKKKGKFEKVIDFLLEED